METVSDICKKNEEHKLGVIEIYCDDDIDRSGIEECKRRTEDLFKECGIYGKEIL
jgi:hypothetical protein